MIFNASLRAFLTVAGAFITRMHGSEKKDY